MSRICFMGTPIFATAILKRLIEEGHEIVCVVSQPDKEVGRKRILTATPVKELALAHQMKVLQPIRIGEICEELKAMDLDLIVTCAYGQFISDEILNIPVHGSINVHASLLPRLRGGAPIHKAIIQGENKSGVSIMRMVKKMDAGPYCHQKSVVIEESDTMGSLHDKLMEIGADCLMECLEDVLQDRAEFIEQDESQATFAYNISSAEELIDFSQSALSIYNQIRGLIPSPCGYAYIEGKKLKFHEVELIHEACVQPSGTIIEFTKRGMFVSLGSMILCVKVLQYEGKAKMLATDFANGIGKSLLFKRFE